MSRVILVAPTYMNLYEDIITALIKKGYQVQYYPDKRFQGDPFNKVFGGKNKIPVDTFMCQLDTMWSEILSNDPFKACYDFLLVVDGLSVPISLFEKLRKANPNIILCNYLYDRVKGVYELDRNFPYYDRIFSFDLQDCSDYHLNFLPIYWTNEKKRDNLESDIFGFGAYDKIRLNTFRQIKRIAAVEGYSEFIKIYNNYNNIVSLTAKHLLKKLMGREHFPISDIFSGMFTNKPLSPIEFKEFIAGSKIIIDTNHPYQDGLTARFMWALGAEKKIVTTNTSVRQYAFFSTEQIFVLDNNWHELPVFLKSDYTMVESIRNEIRKYRIDNWLDTILS